MNVQHFNTWTEALDECDKWGHDCSLRALSTTATHGPRWQVRYNGDVHAIEVTE